MEQLLNHIVGNHRLHNHHQSWKARTVTNYLGVLARWNAGLLAYHERT